MTVAHKLRTSWIYNWRTRRESICLKVIFPFFLAVAVAIFLSIIVWLVLGTAHNEDIKKLKYGGLPASMIVAAWGLVKSIMSFVKPVSSQVGDYICLPDHSQNLGYHQKVIDDVNFLKQQLYYKRSWKWEVFAFIWCCVTWSWNENYVPETKIPKLPPAFNDNLRIIVFVDDLDRCEENVILQVLSAVNLVLATCQINVILSMENSMIQRAIVRKYGNNDGKASSKSNEHLADNYLRKIIQLPLQLPDPSEKESREFLQSQLGSSDNRKGSTIERRQTYGRRKANPKFQIGDSSAESKSKLGRGGKMKGLAEIGDNQGSLRISDTTQQGLASLEDHDIVAIGKTEGSEAKEAKIEIHETMSIEQSNIIEKPERASPIARIFIYGCALPCLCNVRSHKKIDQATKVDEQAAGDQQRQEDNKGNPSLMDDLSSIISSILIPKYSQGEINAFHFLHARCTCSRKLPREWKCFLAYHRLAWNILSLTHDVDPVEGWQDQLIAWIFVCWEWRDLITTLLLNWNNLSVLRRWKAVEENTSGPSLREIVEHYIDERWPADQASDSFHADKKRAVTKKDPVIEDPSITEEVEKISDIVTEENMRAEGNDYLRDVLRKVLKEQEETREILRKSLKEQEEMREILKKSLREQGEMREALKTNLKEQEEMREMLEMIKKRVFEEEEEGSVQQYTRAEEQEEWCRLKETLRLHNVSMDGIQAFQKFRFYCQPGYLPWPLPKQA